VGLHGEVGDFLLDVANLEAHDRLERLQLGLRQLLDEPLVQALVEVAFGQVRLALEDAVGQLLWPFEWRTRLGSFPGDGLKK
jgi:hypothetical protein